MSFHDIRALLWISLKAVLIAIVFTPIIRDVFRSYNLVDRPGRRKVHAYPIPRVGGIPIAAAFVFALASLPHGANAHELHSIWSFLPAATVIFMTGLLDDLLTLGPLNKLFGQVGAALIAFASGLRIDSVAGWEVPLWISLPVTVFWLLLTTNALNLIDGLDGLCTGLGLVAVLTLFGAAVNQGNHALAQFSLPLAGALLGFLCYNFNPATVFLGDSGALLIGFLLGCYSLLWTGQTTSLVGVLVPLLALTIPLLDVSLSVMRRFLRNRPIFAADRGHIHHRLLDRGFSTRRAALILYLTAALSAVFGILLADPQTRGYRPFIFFTFGVLVVVGVWSLRYAEFETLMRLIFKGEFQKTVDSCVRIQDLATTLNRAQSEADWWNTLTGFAKESGWDRMWGRVAGTTRELGPAGSGEWTFEIALGTEDWLKVGGPLKSQPVDLLNFAAAVRTSHAIRCSLRAKPQQAV